MKTELKDRCARIEESYEFMLAYAAQGLRTEPGAGAGSQIRTTLVGVRQGARRTGRNLHADCARRQSAAGRGVRQLHRRPRRDASDAQAAIQLVLAQPSISSQMVDNLNASIHLRALLTDLFLIDEIVRPERINRTLGQRACGIVSKPQRTQRTQRSRSDSVRSVFSVVVRKKHVCLTHRCRARFPLSRCICPFMRISEVRNRYRQNLRRLRNSSRPL